jgi:hypothetical protein
MKVGYPERSANVAVSSPIHPSGYWPRDRRLGIDQEPALAPRTPPSFNLILNSPRIPTEPLLVPSTESILSKAKGPWSASRTCSIE